MSKLGCRRVRMAAVLLAVVCGWVSRGLAAELTLTNGLSCWFDAASLTLEDGKPVFAWEDRSESGHDAAQPVTTSRPVFITNVVNGLPVVRFDGADDVLEYDGAFLANTDYTIFCVEARGSGKTDNYLFGGDVSVNDSNLHLGYRNDTTFTHAHWGNDYNITIPAFTNKQFKIHSWHLDSTGGSGRKVYTDGVLMGRNASTTVLAAYTGAMLGGRRTAERFEGDVAEVLMYDRFLDEAERNRVGHYLGQKYGISNAYVDPGMADIAIVVKLVTPAVVSVGDVVEYTVTAVNHGFTNASSVVVSNAIPAGLDLISAAGGSYSGTTGEWTIGDLGYLASATLSVRATVKPGATGAAVVCTAGVLSAAEDDPEPANNVADVTMYVRDEVDPAAFPFRMRIDFSGYDRSETLTNFPALIVLNEAIPAFDYSQFASAHGYDLRFVAQNGTTVLNHDAETWDAAGDSLIWVQVDALAAGGFIWAYWGNPALTAPPAAPANGLAWAGRFAGVWHLGETAAGDDALDAAPGGNDGVPTGEPGAANGMIAGGRELGGLELFTVGDGVDLSGSPFTVSVWANRLPASGGDNFWVGGGVNQVDSGLHLGFRNANLWFGLYSDDGTCTNDYSGDRGTWHFYSMVLDENHGKQIYRDGVPVPTSGVSNGFYLSSGLLIGGTYAGTTFRGTLDEVRASDVARSADWVWAEWLTVVSNDTFATYNEVVGLPTMANAAPTGITDTAFFANGVLWFTGAVPTTVTLLWGESDGGAAWGGWSHTNMLGLNPVGPLSIELAGLTAHTVYAYTYYASNSYGETWATPSYVLSTRMPTYWTVTPSADPNGMIQPSAAETVNDGDDSSIYTFAGAEGYHLTNVLVDASLIGPGNSYQFVNVTADHSIRALFGLNHYTVTVVQAANGLVSPTGPVDVAHGTDTRFTIEPVAGYYVEDVLVGGVSMGPLDAYVLENVTASQTITAIFSELPPGMVNDGLVLWLDGERLDMPDGTPVAEWLDYSGRGNHARQTVSGLRPQFYNDNLGRHVYFDGADAFMTVANEDAFDFTTNMTIIMVGRQVSTDQWEPFISKNGEPSGWQFREAGNRNRLSFTTRGLTGGNTDDPEGVGDIQIESVLAGRYEGATGTKQVWYNGTLDGTLVYTGGQISTNDSAVLLGARDNGGTGGYAQCDIYELFVYDAALTDRELNAIGYYLAQKYGIASDYTDPVGPTIVNTGSRLRTATAAQLDGVLVSTGSAPTTVWAYWDTVDQGTSNRLAWARAAVVGGQEDGPLSVLATGLQGDTDYVCRFFASNAYGVAWSDSLAFESGIVFANYTNSLKIQFSGYAGTTPLTNFPALVALSPSVSNFSYDSFASIEGTDLRFMDATLSDTLNYEVDKWVMRLKHQDIGAVGAAGNLSVNGKTYTLQGSGADVWGRADEFHYAYTTLRGDGAISVRVRDIANPGGNAWCKSGVMIRENLYADTRNVFMVMRTDGQTVFQYRDAAGADSVNAGLAAGTVPGWLRLERSGNTFTGYASTNGVMWTQRGQQSVAMATNVLIGLAVTSHADGSLSTVSFDHVSIDVPDASHVWVQVPKLASSTDHIWAFWGNADRTSAPPYTTDGSTWSHDYGAVWHMTEPNAMDSTINNHDGTANANFGAIGLIGDAQSFTNVGSIAVNSVIDLARRSFSFEAWSRRSVAGDNDFIAGQGQGGDMLHIGFRTTGQFAFAFWGDDLNVADSLNNDTAAWHHWTCVYDAATKSQRVFRDGAEIGNRTAGDDFTGGGTFHIGARGDAGYNFQGEIDEVRLSNVTLSQDWIVASYSNQVAASTFISFSDEAPAVPVTGMFIIVR